MRHRPLLCASASALVLFVLALLPPERSRADGGGLTHFAGTWIYADGARGLRQIDSAVERSISGMAFFIVPIARDMVRGRTIHFREIRIGVEGEVVRFATESWGPVATRVGAAPIPITAP